MKKTLLFLLLCVVSGCVINFKAERPLKGIINVEVHYLYPGRNEMSTFDRFYKKEIEKGHFAETKLELDPGQQLLVLNKAFVLHFFQMPDTFYHKGTQTTGETAHLASASPIHFLRIHADSLDKTIYWRGATDDLHPDNYHPRELIEYIDSIVRSTDQYQGLPKAKGEDVG